MAKCASVNDIKKSKVVKQKLPQEGSKTRQVFDRLTMNPCIPQTFEGIQFSRISLDTTLQQLQDRYGLDIRQVRRGSKQKGIQPTWALVGEWFGSVYVDYLVETI